MGGNNREIATKEVEAVKPREITPKSARARKFTKAKVLLGGLALGACIVMGGCDDGKSKKVDAGTDAGLSGSELCTDEFAGHKWQALIGTNDVALVGPEGHWLKGVEVDPENGAVLVSFQNVDGEAVMTNGDVMEGEGSPIFTFDENNKDITVTFGGVEQTISFCGFFFYEGEIYAFLQTDALDGFFKCEFVEDTLDSQSTHEVNSNVAQERTLTIAKEGFTPDESYDPVDPACEDPEQLGGIVEKFVSEDSTFTGGLDANTVPSTELSYVNVRGGEYLVVSAVNGKVQIVGELGSDTLAVGDTVSAEYNGDVVLQVVYLGLDIYGKHSFGANYEGESDGYVVVSEVEGEPNLRLISVLSETNPGVTIDEFVVRFEELVTTDEPALKASIYREGDIKQLQDGGAVAIRSKEAPDEGSYESYDVALTVDGEGAVTGWTLSHN